MSRPSAEKSDKVLKNPQDTAVKKRNPATVMDNTLSGIPVAVEDSIIECEQCGASMRIYKSGRHLCPSCGIEFFVKHDGAASYFEKLAR